jgi:uncharacterized membrane protein
MEKLGTAKILGGIGALLMLLGFIPVTAGLLSFIGFILVFIAVKMIADETKEKGIFNNYLYSFVAFIIAIVALIAMAFVVLSSVGGIQFFYDLQNMAMSEPLEIWNAIQPALFGAIAGILVFWIIAVIASLFFRKSFNLIAEKTGVKWFATTGLLFFIGVILTIILIGFIILIIAMILEIIAFFSLPDNVTKDDKKISQRKCPHCDKEIPEDAVSCPYCGKKL